MHKFFKCVCLVLILCLSTFVLASADEVRYDIATTGNVSVNTTDFHKGDTVTVDVMLGSLKSGKDVLYIGSLDFSLSYNPFCLKPLEYSSSNSYVDNSLKDGICVDNVNDYGEVLLAGISSTGFSNNFSNSVKQCAFSFKFEILEDTDGLDFGAYTFNIGAFRNNAGDLAFYSGDDSGSKYVSVTAKVDCLRGNERRVYEDIDSNGIGDNSKYSSIDISDYINRYYGDIDNDGAITSADSLFILRMSVGLEKSDFVLSKLADVDADNCVTSADALDVLRYSVKLPSSKIIGQGFKF